jgi:hypothetical protein
MMLDSDRARATKAIQIQFQFSKLINGSSEIKTLICLFRIVAGHTLCARVETTTKESSVLIGSDLDGCKTFIFKLILMDFGDEKMMMMLEENSNEVFSLRCLMTAIKRAALGYFGAKITFPSCRSHLP